MNSLLLLLDLPSQIQNSDTDVRLIAAANGAIGVARSAGISVGFARVAFRAGHPEVSPRNTLFRGVAAADSLVEGRPDSEYNSAIDTQATDLLVTKRRVSAFSGSDLGTIIRARDVDRLVVGGTWTRGAVLSTVCSAADLDLEVVVLDDVTSDPDPVVQDALLNSILPLYASVMSTMAWAESLAD
jgi:Amidases related to nicotinamidase